MYFSSISGFILTFHTCTPRFTSPFRQFIAGHTNYKYTDTRGNKLQPSVPVSESTFCICKPLQTKTQTLSWFLPSLPYSFIPSLSTGRLPLPSLCTICRVRMRFAGGSLSTAEQQGDWGSQSGNRERSPVSEKCKYSAIQRPQSRRDRDENNSYYTALTRKEHRGHRGG